MTLNLAMGLRSTARRYPDRTAIVLGEAKLSYAELHNYVRKFAGALRELGIEPGQHIALMLPNVPHFTIAYYGGHYAAAPIVPLNVLLTPDEIAYHLDDSDAVALVAWEGFFEQAQAGFNRADGCKHLIVAKASPTDLEAPPGAHNMNAMLAQAKPVNDLPPTHAMIQFTAKNAHTKLRRLRGTSLYSGKLVTLPRCPGISLLGARS